MSAECLDLVVVPGPGLVRSVFEESVTFYACPPHTHTHTVCLRSVRSPPALSKLQLPQTQRGLGQAECLWLPGLPSYMQECAAAVCGAECQWLCVSLGSARVVICVFLNQSINDPSPDEANENEGPGQLNNQLSWKQGRQLLRQ